MARSYKKRGDFRNCLYMKVTDDKYELPIAVSSSVYELATKTGANRYTISSCIAKECGCYRRIKIREENDDV